MFANKLLVQNGRTRMPLVGRVFVVVIFILTGASQVWQVPNASAAGISQEIYVSPNGSDGNPGTVDQPIKTLAHARDMVRLINQSMTEDITIVLRGGTYRLSGALQLDADDSGMNGHNVIYKNFPSEQPIVSGGEAISSWAPDSTNAQLWQRNIGANRDIRQLFVNGEREIRARSNAPLPVFQKASGGYLLNSPDISSWQNITDIEFVSSVLWKQYRCRVQSVSLSKIIMQQPCWNNAQLNEPTMDSPSYIENAMELLDAPQEWYYNKATGWLYYYPYSGQDMTTAEVIVPTLANLVIGEGALNQPIHNISWQGITFEDTTWLGPSSNDGYAAIQASLHYVGQNQVIAKMPAAIDFHAAKNITIQSNVFIRLGGSGLTFDQSSQNNTISANHFTDISGSAIQIGDVDQPHVIDTLATSGNTISDNYIRDIGKEYQDAVAIWLGYVSNNIVQHNELSQLPYSGISIGWGWGNDDPSVAKNNLITNNYIHDHLLTMNDGGGIYSLGAQPGNIISDNVVTGQRHLYGSIYLDAGSRGITVHHNAVFDNLMNMFAVGGENTFDNNYWQNRFAGDLDFFPPATPFGPNVFTNNHLINDQQDIPADLLVNAGLENGFSATQYLAYPVNLQSTCDPTGQYVQLSWKAATGNPNYIFSLDNSNDSTAPTLIQTTALQQSVTIDAHTSYRWTIGIVGDPKHVTSSTFDCQDLESPTVPTNVGLIDQTVNSLKIAWDKSTDNDQLGIYTVFRDGVAIGTSSQPFFADSGLQSSTDYSYTVQVADISGNLSSVSSALLATTLAAPLVISPPLAETPPAPSPSLPPLPQVLGVTTFHPVMKTLSLAKGVYTYHFQGKRVNIRPFATSYQGQIWARRVDLGDGQILYIFINSSAYRKGQIMVYQADGKFLKSYQPYGGFATSGLNTAMIVESNDQVYLAVSKSKAGTTVKTYQVMPKGLHALTSLTSSIKLGNILIGWQKLYKGQYGLVTKKFGDKKTLKVWKLNLLTNKFFEDKNINKTKIKI